MWAVFGIHVAWVVLVAAGGIWDALCILRRRTDRMLDS